LIENKNAKHDHIYSYYLYKLVKVGKENRGIVLRP